MSRCGSLLEVVRGLLERTYRIRPGIRELGPFVIGDAGYRLLYREREAPAVGASSGGTARTLVRETAEGVLACIYFPDSLIRQLEAHPPWRGLGEENVDAFATFVEEVDHLLTLAERARQDRPISMFELELHANVSKQLVLERFLAGREPRLSADARVWLRHRLFERGVYSDEDPAVRSRYRDAARWAVRFLNGLRDVPVRGRLGLLRRFHGAGGGEKIQLIRGMG